MKIAIACDHGGLNLKNAVIAYLEKNGHEVVNFGTDTKDSCDYPDFAVQAAEAVASGKCDRGILICGTGVGISLSANKVKGIRCVVCSEPYSAKLSREHNDTNILAFGARVVGQSLAEMIVDAFMDGVYEGGRHARRVEMIAKIENGEELC